MSAAAVSSAKPGSALVDVRSLKEYAGELLAPDRRHLRRRIGQLSAAQLAAVLTGIDTVLGR